MLHSTPPKIRAAGTTLLLLLIFSLAACGPTGASNQASGKATQDAASTAAPTKTSTPRSPTATFTPVPTSDLGVDAEDLQDLEIEFWHPWSGETGKAVGDLVSEFNRSNEWGVRVKAAYQGNLDDLSANMEEAIKVRQTPDVSVGYNYQALGWEMDGEIIVDLHDYVDDPIWGYNEDEIEDFYPAFWEHDMENGRRTGLPALRTAQLLFYNQTWAEELGFEAPPTTTAQFETQACAASRALMQDGTRQNDGRGGWIISTDYPGVLGWIQAFGGEVVSQSGNGYDFDNQQVANAFRFLRNLLDQGCAWIPENDPPETEFVQRGGLLTVGSAYNIPHQEALFADLGSKDMWTVLPFPSLNNSHEAIPVYGPSFQVLESTPEKQLAAWLFIKWLTTPESQAILANASAYFPVRTSSMELIESLPATYPQWEVAEELLGEVRHEPPYASWASVRWAVSDAATQLFRYYFTIDQVPTLVELLNETAAELHKDNP